MDTDTLHETISDPDDLYGPQVIQAIIKKPGMLMIIVICYVLMCMYYFIQNFSL